MDTFALIAVGLSHIILAVMYRRLDDRHQDLKQLVRKTVDENIRLRKENARLKRIVTR